MPRIVFARGRCSLIRRMPSIVSTARAGVVLVARRAREHERVEDDVVRPDAVLLRQQLVRALRHLQLALARDRLRLLLILVDAADDERRAVACAPAASRARTCRARPRG